MNIKDNSIILKFDLHGFNMDDIKIDIENNEIRIVAKRDTEKKMSEKNFKSFEKSSHNFNYFSQLPPVKEKDAVIDFKHGILKITIPTE